MNWSSKFGPQLYALLPAEYRARDNHVLTDGKIVALGDLARYLDACGEFLDKIDATLEQRLADIFPDNDDPQGSVCQDWVLPYLAQLLDVRLVSPSAAGQREEIANAVSWRKGKGTGVVAEEIAQAVSRLEVELQEGWQRIALTPRVGMPLVPATALGEDEELDVDDAPPQLMARHPGIAAVTVDFRRHSRAVISEESNPVAKQTHFADSLEPVWWRQANSLGAACFPGSYEDKSLRTVDIREPDWRRGHFHGRRLQIYYPPEPGFFPNKYISLSWGQLESHPEHVELEELQRKENGSVQNVYRIRGLNDTPLRITGTRTLSDDVIYRFENVCIDNTLTISAAGRVEFENCAVKKVIVETASVESPVIDAVSTLFEQIRALDGLVRMAFCTLLGVTFAKTIQASDCVFAGTIRRNATGPVAYPVGGCIRYSCLPKGFSADHLLYRKTCVFTAPVFYADRYKDYGAGVLHPATIDKICKGSEDGGEMGAFHNVRYCLGRQAVIDKMADYLPVGIRPLLIPDARLLCTPPELSS